MRENLQKNYTKTIFACFAGYVIQAIINNYVPLLFLTFQDTYHIPLSKITLLATFNFLLQLLVDLVSISFVDRIGYRASIILAHMCSAAGFVCLTILPDILPDPFTGILISVMIYAVGGGLIEVLVSPIMEACPTDNKKTAMSLLHSFYCWGQAGVVLFSTIYFHFAGVGRWKDLAIAWAVFSLVNGLVFLRAPIGTLIHEGESSMPIGELFRSRLFWILLLFMVCAGASELGVSQWASTFAEQGLGVTKAIGDLAGPMFFAILMGGARTFYGKFGEKIALEKFMAGSALLCVISYLLISLAPHPLVSLLGFGLCGLSVGIMWPGTFSIASAAIPTGGTALFALLALAGDLGCSGGPSVVGMVSSLAGDNLHIGILIGTVFPAILFAGLFPTRKKKKAAGRH